MIGNDGRTVSTIEGGYRAADDPRTHAERINGTGPGRWGEPLGGVAPTDIDYNAPRLPYRTIEWTVRDGARVPPGSIVYLQPHELGSQYVVTEEAMDLLKEIDDRMKQLADYLDRAERVVSRLEAAAAPAEDKKPSDKPKSTKS